MADQASLRLPRPIHEEQLPRNRPAKGSSCHPPDFNRNGGVDASAAAAGMVAGGVQARIGRNYNGITNSILGYTRIRN